MPRKKKIVPDYTAMVQGYYNEILAIDAMPSDGDRRRKGTEFQTRRYEQMNFMLGVWTEFFPGRDKPTYAELQDFLGIIYADSLLEAMTYFANVATRQHVGRGVIIKDANGKPISDKETGKVKRTPRKIKSIMAYLRDEARRGNGKKNPVADRKPGELTA